MPELTKPIGGPATLPKLDFDITSGCGDVLSARQLDLHYNKHHKAYVDRLNSILGSEKVNGGRFDGKSIEEIVTLTSNVVADKVLFNQAAQHFNHSFYWKCLTPNGSPMDNSLKSAVESEFESVKKFQEKFEAAGLSNFGSGWTWLVWDNVASKLMIENTGNAGCPIVDQRRPIFTIDVWEHAYYKDYENRRAEYLQGVWRVVNWSYVGQQLSNAKKP